VPTKKEKNYVAHIGRGKLQHPWVSSPQQYFQMAWGEKANQQCIWRHWEACYLRDMLEYFTGL
jgi:hypothetical protein